MSVVVVFLRNVLNCCLTLQKLSRLMLLEENQIAFHSEDGLIFDGVKDYSRQIAEMIGLGSDYEFIQAGVSHILYHTELFCYFVQYHWVSDRVYSYLSISIKIVCIQT